MRAAIRRELLVNIIVFLTVIAICVGYLAFAVYHVNPGKKYTNVSMQIGNTYLVVPGTSVTINGVRVGSVTEVTPNIDGALVELKYEAVHKISQHSRVQIGQQSAIGEPYVDFATTSDPGPVITDGMRIGTEQIDEPQSIPRIFDLLNGMTSVFAADPLTGIMRTVWESLEGTEEAVPQLIDSMHLLGGIVVTRQAKLRNMFANTQVYTSDLAPLIATMDGAGASAVQLVDEWRNALAGVERLVREADGRNTLTTLLTPFLSKVNSRLAAIWPNLNDTLAPLVPIAAAMNQTLPQIDVSALISTALSTFGSDGAARLRVTLPPPENFPPNTATTTRPPR